MSHSALLTMDAAINLVFGALLIVFPRRLVSVLGIPNSDTAFYPSILGAVLCGIGVALLIERSRGSEGLGLLGAVAINLCSGIALALWLLSGRLALPLRGLIVLGAVTLILVCISCFELLSRISRRFSGSV